MNLHRVAIVVRKDLRELTANRMVMLPMIIVPLVFCILVPALIGGFGLGLDSTEQLSGEEMLKAVVGHYSIPAGFQTPAQEMVFVVLNYTFLPLFMVVPLMVATIIAASAIVGEKERKTLETLLYTPISNRELMIAKLAAAFLPAVAAAVVGFIGYFLVGNLVSLLLIGRLVVRAWVWLPAILLLSPAVSLLGLSVTLYVSRKAKTFLEAQQTSGFLVLPLVLLVVVQITGVVVFKPIYVVLFSLILFFADYLLVLRVLPRFTREGIIKTL